jgi:hypothetical protein
LLEQTASSSVSSECERRNLDSFLVIFSASGSMQTICGIGDRKPRLRILDLARNPIPSRTGRSCVALAKSAVYQYHNKHFHELLWIPPDNRNLASSSQSKSHIPISRLHRNWLAYLGRSFDSCLRKLIVSTFFPSIRRIQVSEKIFQVRKIHNDEGPVAFKPE